MLQGMIKNNIVENLHAIVCCCGQFYSEILHGAIWYNTNLMPYCSSLAC